jgi:hypothetical protein
MALIRSLPAQDGGSVLRLTESEGRDRIVLRVAADGTPQIQLLDATGNAVGASAMGKTVTLDSAVREPLIRI